MIWWWPDQYHGGFDDIDSVVSGQDDTGGYIAFCHWLRGLFATKPCWLFLTCTSTTFAHGTSFILALAPKSIISWCSHTFWLILANMYSQYSLGKGHFASITNYPPKVGLIFRNLFPPKNHTSIATLRNLYHVHSGPEGQLTIVATLYLCSHHHPFIGIDMHVMPMTLRLWSVRCTATGVSNISYL